MTWTRVSNRKCRSPPQWTRHHSRSFGGPPSPLHPSQWTITSDSNNSRHHHHPWCPHTSLSIVGLLLLSPHRMPRHLPTCPVGLLTCRLCWSVSKMTRRVMIILGKRQQLLVSRMLFASYYICIHYLAYGLFSVEGLAFEATQETHPEPMPEIALIPDTVVSQVSYLQLTNAIDSTRTSEHHYWSFSRNSPPHLRLQSLMWVVLHR